MKCILITGKLRIVDTMTKICDNCGLDFDGNDIRDVKGPVYCLECALEYGDIESFKFIRVSKNQIDFK